MKLVTQKISNYGTETLVGIELIKSN